MWLLLCFDFLVFRSVSGSLLVSISGRDGLASGSLLFERYLILKIEDVLLSLNLMLSLFNEFVFQKSML